MWNSKGKDGGRIDVENPGNRKGQIHYQEGKSKYLYDKDSNTFRGAPRRINDLLKNNKEVKNAIDKGMKYLGTD